MSANVTRNQLPKNWLLCRPDYYAVAYQINPWMNVSKAPIRQEAINQYAALVKKFAELQCHVEFVDPISGLPDMVFTANAGIVRHKQFVLARFRFKERQGEERYFEDWFAQHGYSVHHLQRGAHEGEGDALFCRPGILFGGVGFRSDTAAQEEAANILNCSELVICELSDPRFYHLDTCFTPIDASRALFVPSAFSKSSIKRMEQQVELHEVPEIEALRFACNSVVLGNDILIPSGCPQTEAKLQGWGLKTHPLAMSEFLKAGGAAKCLSLQLSRDE